MRPLCYIDTETTGLDANIHQAYEVAWWVEDKPLLSIRLPHTLENADPVALDIGKYHERGFEPRKLDASAKHLVEILKNNLYNVTLVGANPAFDAGFLKKHVGAPWHYRLLDVETYAMPILNLDRPIGLHALTEQLREKGYVIYEPDHSATADVMCVKDVHEALIDLSQRARKARDT